MNVPDSSFAIREITGKDQIVITTEHISGPTALEKVQEATNKELQQLINLLAHQAERIIYSLAHKDGVGYDVALHNFIIRNCDQRIFCVDFTPPRNTTSYDPSGSKRPIPFHNLLVNYPEVPALNPPGYEHTLRNLYYTPHGTLQHLYGWLVAARFYTDESIAETGWWRGDTQHLFEELCRGFLETSWGRTAVTKSRKAIEEGELDSFIARRICRQRGLPPSAVPYGDWTIALKLPRF